VRFSILQLRRVDRWVCRDIQIFPTGLPEFCGRDCNGIFLLNSRWPDRAFDIQRIGRRSDPIDVTVKRQKYVVLMLIR
jgi:hypothetical protein